MALLQLNSVDDAVAALIVSWQNTHPSMKYVFRPCNLDSNKMPSFYFNHKFWMCDFSRSRQYGKHLTPKPPWMLVVIYRYYRNVFFDLIFFNISIDSLYILYGSFVRLCQSIDCGSNGNGLFLCFWFVLQMFFSFLCKLVIFQIFIKFTFRRGPWRKNAPSSFFPIFT